jgi:hypothetical protein
VGAALPADRWRPAHADEQGIPRHAAAQLPSATGAGERQDGLALQRLTTLADKPGMISAPRFVRALALTLALLVTCSGAASAQDDSVGDDERTRGPLVGLLNLPEIFVQGCGASPSGTADIRTRPSTDAPLIGRIAMRVANPTPDRTESDAALVVQRPDGRVEPLRTAESGYEIPAAIVRARRGSWYRIDLDRGSGWIRRPDARHFERYPELLLNDRLTYIRRWDARLWRVPGRGTPVQAPPAWRQAAWDQYQDQHVLVRVLAIRRLRGAPWLQVRVVSSPCGDPAPPMTPWTGWLPAYTRTGDSSVWFFSRGC